MEPTEQEIETKLMKHIKHMQGWCIHVTVELNEDKQFALAARPADVGRPVSMDLVEDRLGILTSQINELPKGLWQRFLAKRRYEINSGNLEYL